MIITFKSPAAGDLIMFGDVAQRLLHIMGKDPSEKGIITVEQLPSAITQLKAAIAEDKAQLATSNNTKADADQPDTSEHESSNTKGSPMISLYQRATPLLELLTWAMKKNKPVVWGN